MRRLLFLLILMFVVSCSDSETEIVNAHTSNAKELPKTIPVVENLGPETFEGLVDVKNYSEDIFVDLKYATKDNFMGLILYERTKRAYLQVEVAQRLAYCQSYLSAIDSGLHLLVYDAARPVSVQRLMWNALDTVPVKERGKYVSNPANLSLHNMGCAVDITICNSNGIPLDMGAGFDDFRDIAFPNKETEYLKTGELTREQYENRLLLRKVMASQSFRQLPTEWWHYNAFSRNVAKNMFRPLEVEPY